MIFDGKAVCCNSFRASWSTCLRRWLPFYHVEGSQALSKIWTDSAKASPDGAGIAPAELTAMKTIQNFDNRNNVLLPACFIMGQVMNPIIILPESAELQGSASCVE